MGRQSNKILPAQLKRLMKTPGRHSDGDGLYLEVDAGKDGDVTRARWTFIYTLRGKRRSMGLGAVAKPDDKNPRDTDNDKNRGVSLRNAREAAAEARGLVRMDQDPIEARKRAREALATIPTFGEVANDYFKIHHESWRHKIHVAEWRRTIDQSCASILSVPVDMIEKRHVMKVLAPYTEEKKHETASRIRGRLEVILNLAESLGYRSGPNPARLKGNLETLIPKRKNEGKKHFKSVEYKDAVEFVRELRSYQDSATTAWAFEFIILTASRLSQAINARWSEINFDYAVWIIPPERMKVPKEHRVPLSARAIEILREMEKVRDGDFVFPGQERNTPLSVSAVPRLRLRMESADKGTIHGWRSSFRTWAANETNHARGVCEAALAHTVVGVEGDYQLGDLLAKRRQLMDEWASYIEPDKPAGNVVQMNERKAS